MQGLRVTPAREPGRDRLYVTLPSGRTLAWYDPASGRVSLVVEGYGDEVPAALAPFVTGHVTLGPPPVPTTAHLARLALHPDDDLAPNRPGEALHAELDPLPGAGAGRPGTRHRGPGVRRLRADPRRARLAAQQRLGGELDRLEAIGRRVVHAVPLPGADHIDHLAVGPGGVFAVHTLAAFRQRVLIADPQVRTGRAVPSPCLRLTRRRAERAAHALAVAVLPVLAVVGAERLEIRPVPPQDVRILRDGEVPALARLGGVLGPADIDALYATARDRRTWLRV
ncbi:NERD domain-containing protein [Streptomyces sp. NPDC002187]|uniref:NERD domain-containing protein n=1 Tax=Streptomyces sp. NPDC002187 TaxID=3364637 RepID=UPI003677BD81